MGLLKIEGVTHWSIPVNNLDEAEKFYGDLLGLKPLGRLGNSGMSCFNVGDNNILLCERAASVDKSHVEEQNVHHSFTVTPETLVQACKIFAEKENSHRPALLPGERVFHGQGALFLRPQRQSPRAARSDVEGGHAGANFRRTRPILAGELRSIRSNGSNRSSRSNPANRVRGAFAPRTH